MTNDQVYVIARNILDEARIRLNNASQAAPDRQYVTSGQTAHDCDQLTVTLVRIYAGFIGAEGLGLENRMPCARPRIAEYLVELVRCFPALREKGRTPTPGAIEAAAIELLTDAYVLVKGLSDSAAEVLIAPGGCDDVSIGQAVAGDPSGGMAAVSLTVQVQLS